MLKPHQSKVVNDPRNRIGIFHEMGAGKTYTSIAWAEARGNSCLVITPKSIVEQFKEEIEKRKTKQDFRWVVISKETFKKTFKTIGAFDCVIIDEFHYFLGYTSALHKSLLAYLKLHQIKYLAGLTGTPYLSTAWNAYALAQIMGSPINYYQFKLAFFYNMRMGNRTIPIQKKGKEIDEALKNIYTKHGDFVKMEEVIKDIPKQINQKEFFSLTSEQKKAIASISDFLPIVRFTKIHQICGGTLRGDEFRKEEFYKSEKQERALEYIAENKKIIFVFRYNFEIEKMAELITSKFKNKPIVVINGKTQDRHLGINKANSSDDVVVLINACCSEGYELPSFPIMVFYSLDFSVKNYEQMRARIQRMNNIKQNIYIHFIIKETIDEEIYKTTINKKDFLVELYNKKI